MLREIVTSEMKLPEERTDDFQDMELWRTLTALTAKELIRKYRRNLIIPMTAYMVGLKTEEK